MMMLIVSVVMLTRWRWLQFVFRCTFQFVVDASHSWRICTIVFEIVIIVFFWFSIFCLRVFLGNIFRQSWWRRCNTITTTSSNVIVLTRWSFLQTTINNEINNEVLFSFREKQKKLNYTLVKVQRRPFQRWSKANCCCDDDAVNVDVRHLTMHYYRSLSLSSHSLSCYHFYNERGGKWKWIKTNKRSFSTNTQRQQKKSQRKPQRSRSRSGSSRKAAVDCMQIWQSFRWCTRFHRR